MRKKTVIVISSVVFTIILVGILMYRMYLLKNDASGFYELKSNNWIIYSLTYMPEISIITALIAIWTRKRLGLTFTVLAVLFNLMSFFGEVLFKYIRLASGGIIPDSCIPWLNIPAFIIIIAVFCMKFHIYTLPNEIKIKLKIVNLC
jgi:hypothetical protein